MVNTLTAGTRVRYVGTALKGVEYGNIVSWTGFKPFPYSVLFDGHPKPYSCSKEELEAKTYD